MLFLPVLGVNPGSSVLAGSRVVTWLRWVSVDWIEIVLPLSCRVIIPDIHAMTKVCGYSLNIPM